MKEVNIVSNGISYVVEGKKIYATKPTVNQNYKLIQENSIEMMENQISKNNEEIRENSKVIREYSGKTVLTLLGYTSIGLLTGIIFEGIFPFDSAIILKFDVMPLATSIGLIGGIITSSFIELIKRGYRKDNKSLRMENKAIRELIDAKKTRLKVINSMNKVDTNKKDSVTYFDNSKKNMIKALKEIKEFYTTKVKSEQEFMGINYDGDEILLKKEKKLKK